MSAIMFQDAPRSLDTHILFELIKLTKNACPVRYDIFGNDRDKKNPPKADCQESDKMIMAQTARCCDSLKERSG